MTINTPWWIQTIIGELSETQNQELTAEFLHQEDIFERICCEIQSKLGFDYVAIQIISAEDNFIETVYGSGIAASWLGRAKHYMEPDSDLRDINADIAQTGRTEIISGWDERFNKWMYKEYKHENLVRVFTPIITIKNKDGTLNDNWFESIHGQVESDIKKQNGYNKVIKINSKISNSKCNIIGTVEAGYQNRNVHIEVEKAVSLYQLVSKSALEINKLLLSYGLEVIAEKVRESLKANSITLYFLQDELQGNYIYEACSGQLGKRLLKICPPRKDGLGEISIREQQAKFIPNKGENHISLEAFNPKAFKEGIRAMAAFPLLINNLKNHSEHKSLTGVLYIFFKNKHQFTHKEISQGQYFANSLAYALLNLMTYKKMQRQTRQLKILNSVVESLAKTPEDGNLLNHIAWNMLNILGADIVTIFEYIESDREFMALPATAGRLKIQKKYKEITEQSIPFRLVKRNENIYATQILEEPFFHSFKKSNFIKEEKIKSTAGILLRVGQEVIGVLFINYRHHHVFSKQEKQIIDILASSAAIAIKNQRWLEVLKEVDREIIATLDQKELLMRIAQKVAQVTAAEFGEICLFDLSTQELVIEAIYPEDAPVDRKLHRVNIREYGEGITGWVAKNRQSKLVSDAQFEPLYKPFFKNVRSELCVPLLDKDSGLLGVLNVESTRVDAFDKRDQRRLEALANQVVIALKNVKNNEQQIAIERMETLNLIARSTLHRINNHLGAIQVWAQKIIDGGEQYSQDFARKIRSEVTKALEDRNRIKSWLLDKLTPINVYQIILTAHNRVSIPSNIEQELNIPISLPEIMGTEIQLVDVFYNLIKNAIDAMPDGGELSINATVLEQEKQTWIVVQVIDTGIGIAPENRNQIFDINYTTKPEHDGEGLWLARSYVERIGGKLNVSSVPNQETKFTVLLPAIQTQEL
ncbi:MAG: GAF domain-containing protein [Mastigocoleus sp. MO_167.B18]|nr:GAF domain-containing protein [Mastigocoleus sp. MO_167.B18]